MKPRAIICALTHHKWHADINPIQEELGIKLGISQQCLRCKELIRIEIEMTPEAPYLTPDYRN